MLHGLQKRLALAPRWVFITYAGGIAALTYISMYAFRKPFTVATFDSLEGWSAAVDFKTALLLAQVLGYALSKFIGIKIIAEMTAERRARTLIALVLTSWLALLLLPLLSAPWKLVALFLNGLPLGMIWGLVFGYLEGRRVTEAVGALLCGSFIIGSGLVKTIGRWMLVDLEIPELWMPFAVGALFVLPLILFTVLLSATPPPTAEDIEARQQRVPLRRGARWAFLTRYAGGIVLLVVPYIFLTAMRDFTDNFAAEIWIALGYGDKPAIFAMTSLPVTGTVLVSLSLLMYIRNNRRALLANHLIVASGFAVTLLATWAFTQGMIDGLFWFTALNAGLYLSYVPFNCMLFDRLVAATRSLANAGFLIYVADAFGYLGSVGVLLYKSLAQAQLHWVDFVINGTIVFGLSGIGLTAMAFLYFRNTLLRESASPGQTRDN